MIDKNKQYRTRDGREVRIYAIDGAQPYTVHGAVKRSDGKWHVSAWSPNGNYNLNSSTYEDIDLIEVKPRIKREVWFNVYPGYVSAHTCKEDATACSLQNRIACVKLTIDVEEGEGL